MTAVQDRTATTERPSCPDCGSTDVTALRALHADGTLALARGSVRLLGIEVMTVGGTAQTEAARAAAPPEESSRVLLLGACLGVIAALAAAAAFGLFADGFWRMLWAVPIAAVGFLLGTEIAARTRWGRAEEARNRRSRQDYDNGFRCNLCGNRFVRPPAP